MRTTLSLPTLARALRSGEIDILSSIHETCERVESLDPQIHALLPEQNRRHRLLAEAQNLLARFPHPTTRPPLFGVLFGVKDILPVDGFPTQAGSRLPPELFVSPQAVCVTLLQQAGALVLGKTVTTEFAYFEPGPTRNPRNLAHTPGGSSSGSAAAIAADYCSLALGTQTIGSVIRPAAFCGIVGFKPGFGRIDTTGLIYCSPSLDTLGYFSQDLAGISLVAPLLCRDWRTLKVTGRPVLGIPVGAYLRQTTPEALAAFEKQVTHLAQAGYEVRRVEVLDDIEALNQRHTRLVFAEMAQIHQNWFAPYAPLYRPRTVAAIREGQHIGPQELAVCRASTSELRRRLAQTMDTNGIHLWICPSAPGPAPEGLQATGSPLMNLPWTHAGMPALTLPVDQASNGLPLGLQCVGRWGEDEQVLAYGTGIAQAFSS